MLWSAVHPEQADRRWALVAGDDVLCRRDRLLLRDDVLCRRDRLLLRDETHEEGSWKLADWLALPGDIAVLADLGRRMRAVERQAREHGGRQRTTLDFDGGEYRIESDARHWVLLSYSHPTVHIDPCVAVLASHFAQIVAVADRWLFARHLRPVHGDGSLAETLRRRRD